jgi:ketosteroid isomerase-like protein
MTGNPPFRIVLLAGTLAASMVLAPIQASALTMFGVPPGKPVPRGQKHEYRHEIEQQEDAWRNAILKANSAGLAQLLSDDYTGITAKGAIQTKDQAVSNLKTGAFQITAFNITDRKIRIYNGTAVVTSSAELTGSKTDSEATGKYRYTRVWVRNLQGQWKIVSFEASRVQENSEHK